MSWFSDESFWKTFSPMMFSAARFATAGEDLAALLALLEVEPPARVLDLPCGPGRHTLALAERGFEVTAVDLSPYLLEQARSAAAERGLAIRFERADMREFRDEGAYDLIINLYSSFGYFEDPADDRRVLENWRASLKPGGFLVIEGMGLEALAGRFVPRVWMTLEDGSLFLDERTMDWKSGTISNVWRLIRGGEVASHEFSHRVFSASHLAEMLGDAGLEEVRLYGGYDGRAFGPGTRSVHVARRGARPEA